MAEMNKHNQQLLRQIGDLDQKIWELAQEIGASYNGKIAFINSKNHKYYGKLVKITGANYYEEKLIFHCKLVNLTTGDGPFIDECPDIESLTIINEEQHE